MSLIERIVICVLFGAPAILLIGFNYVRIFSKKINSSPAYFIGGIFGAVAVIAILGDQWKEQWYFILIPIVLDWGLGLVALILSFLLPPPKEDAQASDEK